jgi:hypothetical protein
LEIIKMKKLNSLLTLFLFVNLFGQTTHTFSNKLIYSFVMEESPSEDGFQVQQFIPEKFSETSKNSVLFIPTYKLDGTPGYVFLDGSKAIEIQNKDLNNNFGISSKISLYGLPSNPIDTLYHTVELVNYNNETKTILGKTCTNYLVKNTNQGIESSEFLFCIDEKNEIDNTSFIFPKQEGKFVKGLILRIAPFEGPATEGINLIQIEKVNSTIHFDFEKEYAAYLSAQKELEKSGEGLDDEDYYGDAADDYNYFSEYANQPSVCEFQGFYDLEFGSDTAMDVAYSYLSSLCSYGYMFKAGEEEKFKSLALRDAKTATKNFRKEGLMTKKEANMFYDFIKKGFETLKKSETTVEQQAAWELESVMDSTVEAAEAIAWDEYYYDDPYVIPYESQYAEIKPEDTEFAFTHIEADSPYWNSMPGFCKKLDSILPNFSNADLKLHAKNYAGQICDMYLGEFMSENVWYKGTLDAIRAEQKYFSTVRGTLNNNDTKLLDEFLNSLD